MFLPGDTVTLPTSFRNARTVTLTVVESDTRHTLVRLPDNSEQWYDTLRLVPVPA